MELFKSRPRVVYTNAVGDKVYPVVVDIKKGIKSTEDIQFVSSDVNTGILSVAFIQGNDNYNVTGADVVCSVMRPDASTLELPCEVVGENIVEVPLGINGTSQDGVYSFDFKVLKGGNKVVGTPIMNYSVSLSISNDMVVEEDDRLPILTMLITQVNELKEETSETINQANIATEASKEATANAIEATNNANAVSERVSQETATAISEIKQDTENAIASMSQTTSTAISTMNQNTTDAIASMTQKTNEAVTRVNDSLTNINNTVATKVSELDTAKSDMTNTVSNKIQEVETRFNTLTSTQQQSSEVIDARDGEVSLKARLDRDIEKAKQVYVNVEGSHISTDSSSGYAKDVEILGNTIQSASNLADIRSVGDKVEGQELYEIPVLSVGENIFNNKWELGSISRTTGENVNSSNTKRTDFIKIGGSNIITPCMPKYVKSDGARYVVMIFYDKNKKYLGFHLMGDNYIRNSFTPPVGSEYVRFTMGTTITECEFEVFLDNRSFVAQGNVIESTPYQEDKITILSPTPLEKVGDVADRLIEKDGVWGVEKNIKTDLLCGANNEDFRLNKTLAKGGYQFTWNTNMGAIANKNSEVISSTMKSYVSSNEDYSSNIWIYDGVAYVIHHPTISTADEIKLWLQANPTIVKFASNTPQFIPLPHDQQVKLRTFANKTNISFLTEIEGTIKAQVPKSLGATVNTHTTQISNLNKELDRVKKLEESTVSTVTTESDFTTVEATSNGYFEDVRLEGKTLVNKAPHLNTYTHSQIEVINENCLKINQQAEGYVQLNKSIASMNMKPNTRYTVICNVKENTLSNGTQLVHSYANVFGSKNVVEIPKKTTGLICGLFETVGDNSKPITIQVPPNPNEQGYIVLENLIYLEGDHTQNPPSGYIEGLKSVGQSATTSEDGVDEIVVSSVNENLFDMSRVLYGKSINSTNGDIATTPDWCVNEEFIPVVKGVPLYISRGESISNASSTKGFIYVYQYSKNKVKIDRLEVGTTSTTFTPTVDGFIRIALKYDKLVDFGLYRQPNVVVPHISDKKRLLFYNNETQAWEKPILREWDSIEKHSNGKYYYHQRSGEVVLNGSENWNMNPPGDNAIRFVLNDVNNIKYSEIIATIPTYMDNNSFTTNLVSFGICSRNNNTGFNFHIEKSKLPTQDVAGFKQWLQANNKTVVYQLAQEKVYECTNIDLITYANETNYIVESGAIVLKSILKVHNNISNVVKILQEKVSLLESNVKASQEVQDMMILETDMRMLDIELALMEFVPMKLNLGGSDMLRSATYFNFLKNHIINETYEKEYLENVMNKYLATGRINQDEYDELYKMLYPPVYDIELPIEP